MVVLSAQDAQQIRLAKREVSHATYKLIFENVIALIRRRAEANETDVVYRVPHYMLGRPSINVKHAARYISEKLKIYGYKSNYKEINDTYFVYADWGIKKVIIPKKPKDVRRAPLVDTDIRSNPAEAVRRMELVKLALKNSMKK
jgi:hypothetical protein